MARNKQEQKPREYRERPTNPATSEHMVMAMQKFHLAMPQVAAVAPFLPTDELIRLQKGLGLLYSTVSVEVEKRR